MPTATDRITKAPGVCGGDACIRGHRIPVWVLVNYRRGGGTTADLLENYPSLTPADLEAAWEYAAAHPEEIDRAIQENEAGEEGLVEQLPMQLYADEDFPRRTVEELRRFGHDVLTAQEDGRRSTPDPVILARAHALGRAVLTHNRRDFERLHHQGAAHSGILSAKQAARKELALAGCIHAALAGLSPGRWCIRVNKPP